MQFKVCNGRNRHGFSKICACGDRYVLLEDPCNWVDIDEKTGTITTVKNMDRDSLLLNGTGIYTILIGAIDDGSRDFSLKMDYFAHWRS